MPSKHSKETSPVSFRLARTFADRLRAVANRTGAQQKDIVQRGTETEMNLLELEAGAAAGHVDPELVEQLKELHTRIEDLHTRIGEFRARVDNVRAGTDVDC